MRSVTSLLSEAFIWGVGITRPKPGKETLAGYYITAMLAGTVLLVLAVFLLLRIFVNN
jgi:hypothetical protein